MIFTARQLEELHRAAGSNGHLTLPYRARLSPLASDWVKAKKIALGYSDDGAQKPAVANGAAPAASGNGGQPWGTPMAPAPAVSCPPAAPAAAPTESILW